MVSEEDISRIIEEYKTGMSMCKLSKKYSTNKYTIKKILQNNNIEIRDLSYYKYKKINEKYFDIIDTEEKAYWIGFIYADGCVCKNYSNFHINLMNSDAYHLEKFKKAIESEHKILYDLVNNTGYNSNDKENKYCTFGFSNKNFINCLIKCGVKEHKTYNCNFPNEDIIPNHLIRHFIRGFFDGDGSVYISHTKSHPNRKNNICISFTGTENMLNSICKILNSVSMSNAKVHKYKNKTIYDLKYGGNHIMEKIYHYLYDDSTIYLQRKFDKFYYYFE